MRAKKVRTFWVGIVVVYAAVVSAVIVLDVSLHWGVIVGLKILAVIHILFLFFVVTSFAAKRKQD